VEGARAATPADVGRIVELANALRAEFLELRGGQLWSVREARPVDNDAYRSLVTGGGAIVAVGAIDEYVVGYAIAEIEPLRDGRRLGVVRELFVEEAARAVGVGEAIIEFVLERLRAAGCHGVDAYALPGHRDAKNFFEEQGLTARLLVMHRTL
jgi:GNAT superfamily N-acetyltransferase